MSKIKEEEEISNLTLEQLQEVQNRSESQNQKFTETKPIIEKNDTTNPQQIKLSSDDPAELYERLKEKWGLQQQLDEPQQIIQEDGKSKLEKLMEERKNRKIPKLQQITDAFIQKQQDETVVQTVYSKNEPMPKTIQKMLTEYQGIKGAVNIGQEWTDIIEKGVKSNLKNQEQAANNFFWLMAKKGRLGVDGIAIAFGIFGIVMIPVYFYQRQNRRRNVYKQEIKIVAGVKDWENSSLDIDDVSVQQTYYTQFQEEIQELMAKKMVIQEQISKLLGRK